MRILMIEWRGQLPLTSEMETDLELAGIDLDDADAIAKHYLINRFDIDVEDYRIVDN